MPIEISGSQQINATQQVVWDKLNDPETLKACIPGCESLERTEDGGFEANVRIKIGPVSAKFKGRVALTELNPPVSYRISGQGEGGIAGFAKGDAKVTLEPTADGTNLSYLVNVEIGGKLAQLGQRLVVGTARKLSNEFFEEFVKQVVAEGADVGR